jgi:hypothetical protein
MHDVKENSTTHLTERDLLEQLLCDILDICHLYRSTKRTLNEAAQLYALRLAL